MLVQVTCEPLLQPPWRDLVFDYPTFNPHFKMNAGYRWFYAIAVGHRDTSRWFDQAPQSSDHVLTSDSLKAGDTWLETVFKTF